MYLDEIGVGSLMRQSYGRSFTRNLCHRVIQGQRRVNATACVAITVEGSIHHSLKEGSFNRKGFQSFSTRIACVALR